MGLIGGLLTKAGVIATKVLNWIPWLLLLYVLTIFFMKLFETRSKNRTKGWIFNLQEASFNTFKEMLSHLKWLGARVVDLSIYAAKSQAEQSKVKAQQSKDVKLDSGVSKE